MYAPGIFFLISNYMEHLIDVDVKNKSHKSSIERAAECLNYMSKWE